MKHWIKQPVFEPLGLTYCGFLESDKVSREVLRLPMHSLFNDSEHLLSLKA